MGGVSDGEDNRQRYSNLVPEFCGKSVVLLLLLCFVPLVHKNAKNIINWENVYYIKHFKNTKYLSTHAVHNKWHKVVNFIRHYAKNKNLTEAKIIIKELSLHINV